MATFKTTHSSTAPRDLFYPNVLTPDMKLEASSVQDSFRRVFDMLYKINPPPGSRDASSVLGTPGFIKQFTINLDTDVFMLSGENWNSSTAGVSWNEHTLTYGGTAYTIAAGGPTTNKFIYWSLQDANKYLTSATFPDLDFIDPASGGVASGLVGVWNASDGKFYPFWGTKLAPAFISTALIEDAAITNAKIANLVVSTAKIADLAVTTAKIDDLAVTTAKIDDLAVTNAKITSLDASKITTGTLAASVSITLTRSDTVPAKFIWESTASMYAQTTGTELLLVPNTNNTAYLRIGVSGTLQWANMDLSTQGNMNLIGQGGAGLDPTFTINPAGSGGSGPRFLFTPKVVSGGTYIMEFADFYPFDFTTDPDLGVSAYPWGAFYLSGLQTFKTVDTGIQWVNTTSTALTGNATVIDLYTPVSGTRTNTLTLDGTASATDTALLFWFDGSKRRVKVDASDLGSGVKNYLYLA